MLALNSQPATFGPRSFFQSSFPVVSKQNNPSEPKMVTMRRPSVAGVELQCVDLG